MNKKSLTELTNSWELRMKKKTTGQREGVKLLFVALAIFCFPMASPAERLGLAEVGARAGMSDSNNDQYFEQYEFFTSHNLPWSWDLPGGWVFATRLNITVGALLSSGSTAFIATAGPGLNFSWHKFSIFAGLSPTYLSKEKFEVEDFGGEFHFTSHVGLSYQFLKGYAAGYRIQHLSNAGIYDSNPGLNLHVLELKYVF